MHLNTVLKVLNNVDCVQIETESLHILSILVILTRHFYITVNDTVQYDYQKFQAVFITFYFLLIKVFKFHIKKRSLVC